MSQSTSSRTQFAARVANTVARLDRKGVETRGRGYMKVTLFSNPDNFLATLDMLKAKVAKVEKSKQSATAEALGINCGEGYTVRGYNPPSVDAKGNETPGSSFYFLTTGAKILAMDASLQNRVPARAKGGDPSLCGQFVNDKGTYNVVILATTLLAAKEGRKFGEARVFQANESRQVNETYDIPALAPVAAEATTKKRSPRKVAAKVSTVVA